MAVRSRRLFGPTQITTGGPTVTYTVLSGRTAVVRALYATLVGTTPNEVRVRVGTAGLEYFRFTVPASSHVMLTNIVWNPGDVIRFTCNTTGGSAVNITAFGSLLLGEPE